MEKVDKLDRMKMIQYNNAMKQKSDRVPLVVTYGVKMPDIQKILHSRMPVLHISERMRQVIK